MATKGFQAMELDREASQVSNLVEEVDVKLHSRAASSPRTRVSLRTLACAVLVVPEISPSEESSLWLIKEAIRCLPNGWNYKFSGLYIADGATVFLAIPEARCRPILQSFDSFGDSLARFSEVEVPGRAGRTRPIYAVLLIGSDYERSLGYCCWCALCWRIKAFGTRFLCILGDGDTQT